MDLSHNTSQRTIAHKQNVEEYVYFETIVQIGQEECLIELAAERVKGQDKNLLDLYNVHVKRNPATAHLSTYGQGFSKDSITDKKGKIKAYFINFEGELKHTTNSEGKPIGKSFAEVYNFYRWFGDSKAVDEQGRPLVVYHGTDASFTAFDMSKGRANMDIQGSFFSPWEKDAKGYGSRVGSYYLSIQNPADEAAGYAALRRFQGQNEAGKKAKAYLQSLGYDSVINNNEEFIAFEPRQIKSVDNRGTFDPNEDNIYYQRGYAGSPVKFDRFSLEAIGTGEGAQAHGWGLYFAKNKGTAIKYRTLKSDNIYYKGEPIEQLRQELEKNKEYDRAALNKSYYTIEAQREVDVPFERIISEEFKLDNDSLLILEQALKKAQLDNINILDKSGQYKGYQVVGKISYGGKSFVITLEITTNGRIFLTKAKEATNHSEKSPAAMPTQSAVSNGQGKYSLAEIIDIVNKAESENKIKQSAKQVRLELEKEVVNQQGKRVKARLGKIEYLEWSDSALEQRHKGRALFV